MTIIKFAHFHKNYTSYYTLLGKIADFVLSALTERPVNFEPPDLTRSHVLSLISYILSQDIALAEVLRAMDHLVQYLHLLLMLLSSEDGSHSMCLLTGFIVPLYGKMGVCFWKTL